MDSFLPFLVDSVQPLTSFPFSDAYEVPQDIGRAAEQILKGCLEKNISNRWNIAMVDDVAWGVGWGADGDDATHKKSDDEPELQHPNFRSRPTGLKLQTTIVWEQEERSPSLSFSPAPSFSVERGRRTTESTSRSRSPSFVPSTPPDGARVSPITGLSENLDFHLNSSTRETSSLQSSYDYSVAKPVQRTVGIEGEIANWPAHTNERDDDTEVNAILESKTFMTRIPFTSDRQQQQRSGSVPLSNLRWAKANNTSNLYPECRPTPAEPFLNPGSTLPRSRSAEYRYFD